MLDERKYGSGSASVYCGCLDTNDYGEEEWSEDEQVKKIDAFVEAEFSADEIKSYYRVYNTANSLEDYRYNVRLWVENQKNLLDLLRLLVDGEE